MESAPGERQLRKDSTSPRCWWWQGCVGSWVRTHRYHRRACNDLQAMHRVLPLSRWWRALVGGIEIRVNGGHTACNCTLCAIGRCTVVQQRLACGALLTAKRLQGARAPCHEYEKMLRTRGVGLQVPNCTITAPATTSVGARVLVWCALQRTALVHGLRCGAKPSISARVARHTRRYRNSGAVLHKLAMLHVLALSTWMVM